MTGNIFTNKQLFGPGIIFKKIKMTHPQPQLSEDKSPFSLNWLNVILFRMLKSGSF